MVLWHYWPVQCVKLCGNKKWGEIMVKDNRNTEPITRSMIDDIYRRNNSSDSYKNRHFSDKKIAIDEYTGKRIHYTSQSYFTTKTTANVDHIVPLDELKQRYGGQISNSELRRIANSDYNLAVTAEKLNKAKGNSSNIEYLAKQIRKGENIDASQAVRMVGTQAYSEVCSSIDFAYTKGAETASALGRDIGSSVSNGIKNVTKVNVNVAKSMESAAKAGAEVAMVTFAVSAINNLARVGAGEKSVSEAMQDVALECGSSFVAGGGLELSQGVLGDLCEKFVSKDIGKLIGSELPIAEISLGIMVSHTVWKYANGEIDGEQCITNILLSGAGAMAFKMGAVCGGPAGAIIATLVVSKISETVIAYQQQQKVAKEKAKKFRRIVNETMIALDKQKKILRQLQVSEKLKYHNAFDMGLEHIKLGIVEDSAEDITVGLNCFLSVFNKCCVFKNIDEFNAFFDNEEAVLVL